MAKKPTTIETSTRRVRKHVARKATKPRDEAVTSRSAGAPIPQPDQSRTIRNSLKSLRSKAISDGRQITASQLYEPVPSLRPSPGMKFSDGSRLGSALVAGPQTRYILCQVRTKHQDGRQTSAWVNACSLKVAGLPDALKPLFAAA